MWHKCRWALFCVLLDIDVYLGNNLILGVVSLFIKDFYSWMTIIQCGSKNIRFSFHSMCYQLNSICKAYNDVPKRFGRLKSFKSYRNVCLLVLARGGLWLPMENCVYVNFDWIPFVPGYCVIDICVEKTPA